MDQDQADELIRLMRDIRGLLRLSLSEELTELRDEIFGENEERREAYRMFSNGKSYRKIADKTTVSHTTVSRWAEEWREAGLVAPSERRCIVTPEMLGID